MLTSWKKTRTSIEYAPPPGADRGEESANEKKKGSKKSAGSAEASSTEGRAGRDVAVGAHFVRPSARDDRVRREGRTDPSSHGGAGKKRRKFDGGAAVGGASAAADEEGPVLCLTTSHRVALLGEGRGGDGDGGGGPTESESRSYVARPGAASRFSLRGAVGRGGSGADDGAFAGVIPPGARYDPASNLMYAIRDGGREVAIWTAAPSSRIAGPDEEVGDAGSDAGSDGREPRRTTPSRGAARKRKSRREEREFVGPSSGAIVSQRLRVPEGRSAVTLTPFGIAPSREGKGVPAAVGAAGCCEDGSVWVAVCFPSNGSGGAKFRLLLAEGSSTTADSKASKRRKSSAKTNAGDGNGGWTVLDSHVTGTATDERGDEADGEGDDGAPVLLSFRSVMLWEGEKARVALRSHAVRIREGKGSDAEPSANAERFTRRDVLQLESSRSDVAAELGADGESLSVVHRKEGGAWMFTSVDIPPSEAASVGAARTFPLPTRGEDGPSTVVSFGGVGRDLAAVLTRGRSAGRPVGGAAAALSLRILDVRRKAELSSCGWIEVDDDDDPEDAGGGSVTGGEDVGPGGMMRGARCRGMITDERDGSVALLASPTGGEGGSRLDVVFARLGTGTAAGARAARTTASRGVPLASALRSAAASASRPIGARRKSARPKGGANVDLVDAISGEADDDRARRRAMDEAVDEACRLLATSAKELMELAKGGGDAEAGLAANGERRKERRKGSKSGERESPSVTWREAYRNGSLLISEAKGGKVSHNRKLVNGIKGDTSTPRSFKLATADAMPKRFVEAAFKETASILVSLHREAESTKAGKEFQRITQDAVSVLVDVLRTNLISARAEYGIESLHQGSALLSIVRACPSPSLADPGNGVVGKLHVLDVVLDHVQDIPEGALVSLLRFVLRSATPDDVAAYYSTRPEASKKCKKLARQYAESTGARGDGRRRIGTRLLSEALLEFASKVVTYSNCNLSFLTRAMRDDIDDGDEVETLLLALARLLRSGRARARREGDGDPGPPRRASLSSGAADWTTALADAHVGTIRGATRAGGVVVDRMRRAVRSALAQSEFANGTREILERTASSGRAAGTTTRSGGGARPGSGEAAIAPYSVERLAF